MRTILRHVLAAVFVFAAIDKIFHFHGFVKALGNYVLVPTLLANSIAAPVILAELVIGSALLFKTIADTAAFAAAVLLAIFAAAVTTNYLFSPYAPCGCWFSITLGESNVTHIGVDLALFLVAIYINNTWRWPNMKNTYQLGERRNASL